jgi:hypothetical protein
MQRVLSALRSESEGQVIGGWRDVYLDNAKAKLDDMSMRAWRQNLSLLAIRGFYKSVDGFAFGAVKVED